jgi:1-deoxy-D-xylulose-5-phosphate reductoisomerase
MKKISILGSTGSIGTQVLDVAKRLGEDIQIVGLAAHSNVKLLADQVNEFKPEAVCISDGSKAGELAELVKGSGARVVTGNEGWIELATLDSADQIVVSVAGTPGLLPTLAAIDAGKEIALASKEVLVAAGEIVTKRANQKGVNIVPIDSEHSAIFQCLNGEPKDRIEKILLTASGGAFKHLTKQEMADVTAAQALDHPTWKMGKKVTVDSATLMNKGLEIIEAKWLFGVEVDKIQVVIHPQSIVHSMVMYQDGSVIAQLGLPDMRLPIQYALLYPERFNSHLPRLDIIKTGQLTFFEPDFDRFPALKLAYAAAEAGGTMPAVMNAADEVAVGLFLGGKIKFLDIASLVEKTMEKHSPVPADSLETIQEADNWARATTEEMAKGVLVW